MTWDPSPERVADAGVVWTSWPTCLVETASDCRRYRSEVVLATLKRLLSLLQRVKILARPSAVCIAGKADAGR